MPSAAVEREKPPGFSCRRVLPARRHVEANKMSKKWGRKHGQWLSIRLAGTMKNVTITAKAEPVPDGTRRVFAEQRFPTRTPVGFNALQRRLAVGAR